MMRSHNGGLFRRATIVLSTVKLPFAIDSYWYETCIFYGHDNEVIERHVSLQDAAEYHTRKAQEFHLHK